MWLEKAQGLRCAVKQTFELSLRSCAMPFLDNDHRIEQLGLVDACLLLSGFALEAAIKAAHMAETQQLSFADRFKEWKSCSAGHGLVQLTELTSLALTESEVEFLERCTAHSLWAGRYPVPTTLALYIEARDKKRLTFTGNDFSLFCSIYDKCASVVRAYPEPWPKNLP